MSNAYAARLALMPPLDRARDDRDGWARIIADHVVAGQPVSQFTIDQYAAARRTYRQELERYEIANGVDCETSVPRKSVR